MTSKHDKKKAISAEIAEREKATGGRFNGTGFEMVESKKWHEGWEYTIYSSTDDEQYRCELRLPNAKAGPKKVIITDHVIANMLIAAFDNLTRVDK